MRASCLLLLLLASGAPGCRTLWALSRPAVPLCEALLVPTPAMGESFTARYGVRVRYRGVDEPFSLLVELKDDELVLVAFNPFGAEIFALVQRGTDTIPKGALLPGFPVPPQNVLGDLHRLRFRKDTELRQDGVAEVRSCGATTSFNLVEERR